MANISLIRQAVTMAIHKALPPNVALGNVWFVDSGHAAKSDDGSHGQDPTAPFATIDYAVGNCTANNNDVIIVAPGHTETISAAGSLTLDIAGVKVVGMGHGATRPILLYTATDATVEVDAANVRIENCIFKTSISAVVVGVNVDAHDFEMTGCWWTFDETGDDFVTMIDITAFDRAKFWNNVFESEAAAGGSEVINLTDTEDVWIFDNLMRGVWADAAIQFTTTLSSRVVIDNNVIYNADTSVYNGIDTGTLSTTGIVTHNIVTALYATAVAKIYRDGDLTSHDNSFCNAVSERGAKLLVATSSN